MKGKAAKGFKYVILLLALVGLVGGCKNFLGGDLGGRNDLDQQTGYFNTFAIFMNGGAGDTGDGGAAGGMYLGTDGTHGIQLLNATQDVDTSFVLPTRYPVPNLGDEPLNVGANLTIDVYVDQITAQGAVADGDYYMYLNSNSIRLRDSIGGDQVVTGLYVGPGATLTLGLNYNDGGSGAGQDNCYVWFDMDVIVDGVLQTKTLDTGTVGGAPVDNNSHGVAGTNRDKVYLGLESGQNMTINGLVNQAGADAAPASGNNGGDGGGVYLHGDSSVFIFGNVDASGGNGDGVGDGGMGATYLGSPSGIYIDSEEGMMVIVGNLNSSGGNGADGGDAGCIEIYADTIFYGMGTMIANGGNGLTGTGGDAGYIEIYADYGSIFWNGTMQSNGGNADLGPAGDGDGIYLYASDNGYTGHLFVSGLLQTIGGTSMDGNGGDGSDVYLYNYGSGDVRITSPVDTHGGNAAGATFFGGDGGHINIYEYGETDYEYGEGAAPGVILLAANFNLSGGNGDGGGAGGYFDVEAWSNNVDNDVLTDTGIFFLGYGDIFARGGNGGDDGGDGGYFGAYTEDAWSADDESPTPVGPIIDETNFFGGAGNGTLGWGGTGIYYDAEAEGEYYIGTTVFQHMGSIDLSGGNGALGGGDSGWIFTYGHDLCEFAGNVNTSGGNGTGANVDGGDANYFEIDCTWDINFTGSADVSGGNGTGTGSGGAGDWFILYSGGQATLVGNVDASGGDVPGASGFGGGGGVIDLFSEWTGTVYQGGYNISGGDANTDGTDGELWIDWTFIDGDW